MVKKMNQNVIRNKIVRNKCFKYLLWIHCIIIVLYTCRAFFSYISITKLEYYLSIFLALSYFVIFLLKGFNKTKNSQIFLVFFVYGLLCFLVSSLTKGPLVSVMGLSSIFLNMFLWNNNDSYSNENNYLILRKVFLFCVSINAIVAIYQYFIDASFFGIVSGYYGDESIMSLTQVTRRAVGFMGSPQSFSAIMGVSLFITLTIQSKKIKIPLIILIIFAGLLSNSRAFGIALILFVVCMLTKMKFWEAFILFFLAIICYIFISVVIEVGSFSLTYISRNFDFSKLGAANIYFSSLRDNSLIEWIFGKGYGLEGWNTSVNSLSFDYSSTESYVISIISQMGLIAAIIYFIWIILLLKNNSKNKVFIFMIIYIFLDSCFTPSFCGYAFSYVAWFAIIYISKYGEQNLRRGTLT